ncbi:MAG: FKBP-type peptidyl-prolyl cis-trans isomerase [Chitinophagaceae bacterium]
MKFSIITFVLIAGIATRSNAQTAKEITTASGLRYTVLKEGNGEMARKGQKVSIYESMSYLSGKQFYSIEKPAPPVKFTLGAKQAIDGVDEAVTGMKVGEVRKLIVPPSLSKRTEYPSNLSKDSTLLYKVELVEITKQ